MIRFQNLALRRGAKLLFSDANLQIGPSEHVGLVGDNGSGKSSLFALLLGDLLPDRGDVDIPASWRVAHVAQHTPQSDRPATEFVIDGDTGLRALEAQLADAEARHDGDAAGHLHAQLADHSAYTARARAESLLLGLGFRTDQLNAPVASFSGGWRMRLALAQTLMQPSDLMLLDEPTNHLDLDAIVWLEDWLRRYPGTLVVVSHDRDFLDAVATTTVHLDGSTVKRYGGNYSTFERERALQLTVQQAAYQRQQQEIAHLQSFVDRFKAKATKAKQAQSRVKALERMELIAPAHASAPLHFTFADPGVSPSPMLVAEDLRCGYAVNKAIVDRVNLALVPGQRIGLLGANGQGKTTLIRTLVGELPTLGGTLRHGKGLRIGYFAQHEIERLRPQDSPLEHLARIAKTIDPQVREQTLRDFLGSFDFPGAMATSPLAPLSGGEKARLALASIVYMRPNLLLLDEPTNHLDLETRHALTMALAQFEGTLVVVSHDRHLLRSTTEQFLLVADASVREYDGDLDDYREWLLGRNAARRGASPDDVPDLVANRKVQRKEEAAERQRLAELRRPIEREIAKLEKQLETLTARKSAIDATLGNEAVYAPERKGDLAELLRSQKEAADQLEQVEVAWLERQEALQWIR